MRHKDISEFISLLENAPRQADVFNPWAHRDKENDSGSLAPEIRKKQLAHYLSVRLGKVRYCLIGEALSYQGGHFTGVPMTSERILLGFQRDRGIYPESILPGMQPRRTSKPEIMPKGFGEPTATIVWGTIFNAAIDPLSITIWNAFPWHPYDPAKGILSNRRLTRGEVLRGLPLLERLLALFPLAKIAAVGRISAQSLGLLNREFCLCRHPAQGGATIFRAQFLTFVADADKS
jgi:hypothetical protein